MLTGLQEASGEDPTALRNIRAGPPITGPVAGLGRDKEETRRGA